MLTCQDTFLAVAFVVAVVDLVVCVKQYCSQSQEESYKLHVFVGQQRSIGSNGLHLTHIFRTAKSDPNPVQIGQR